MQSLARFLRITGHRMGEHATRNGLTVLLLTCVWGIAAYTGGVAPATAGPTADGASSGFAYYVSKAGFTVGSTFVPEMLVYVPRRGQKFAGSVFNGHQAHFSIAPPPSAHGSCSAGQPDRPDPFADFYFHTEPPRARIRANGTLSYRRTDSGTTLIIKARFSRSRVRGTYRITGLVHGKEALGNCSLKRSFTAQRKPYHKPQPAPEIPEE